MKTVLLIRHAKSSWADAGLGDMERPLNERGTHDAPEMARRLKKRGPIPERILCSIARRTQQTARYFSKELKISKENIIINSYLYLADPERILALLAQLPDEVSQVAVIAHNPGITDLANLVTSVRIDNIPTCGIFAVRFPCSEWTAVPHTAGEFLYFDYPKNQG